MKRFYESEVNGSMIEPQVKESERSEGENELGVREPKRDKAESETEVNESMIKPQVKESEQSEGENELIAKESKVREPERSKGVRRKTLAADWPPEATERFGEPIFLLGKGTFGSVFKTTKGFAVKEFHMQNLYQTFLKEVEICKILYQSQELIVLDPDDSKRDKGFIQMPLFEYRFSQAPGLETDLARSLIEKVDALHSLGICHRDLKPSNIMVSKGEVFLIDFSLSVIHPEFSVVPVEGFTKWWCPPEVENGEISTFKGDVWSIGICILQLFIRNWKELYIPKDTKNQIFVDYIMRSVPGGWALLLLKIFQERTDLRELMRIFPRLFPIPRFSTRTLLQQRNIPLPRSLPRDPEGMKFILERYHKIRLPLVALETSTQLLALLTEGRWGAESDPGDYDQVSAQGSLFRCAQTSSSLSPSPQGSLFRSAQVSPNSIPKLALFLGSFLHDWVEVKYSDIRELLSWALKRIDYLWRPTPSMFVDPRFYSDRIYNASVLACERQRNIGVTAESLACDLEMEELQTTDSGRSKVAREE